MKNRNPSRHRPVLLVRGHESRGLGLPAYVIAEVGTNHNGDLETARTIVSRLANSGCDCVKFQIYEAEEIVSARVRARDYGLDTLYGDISAQEMFDRYLKTPKEWFPELRDLCHSLGMNFAATIHGRNGLEWASRAGVDVLKIASMDHNNVPLLQSLVNVIDAPILISVGMAELHDIDIIVATLRDHQLGYGLFHCCSLYPPKPEELRLSNIPFLSARYGVPVGFSDHSEGDEASQTALDLGAVMFEKHVTLDRRQPGPDHPFAMEMNEFKAFVAALKRRIPRPPGRAWRFMGPLTRERENFRLAGKSVITRRALTAGHVLRDEDIYVSRPGTGIRPEWFAEILGCALARDVGEEVPLNWTDLERERSQGPGRRGGS